MSKLPEKLKKAIDEIVAMRQYGLLSSPDTFNDYNQGWQDGIDHVEQAIEEWLSEQSEPSHYVYNIDSHTVIRKQAYDSCGAAEKTFWTPLYTHPSPDVPDTNVGNIPVDESKLREVEAENARLRDLLSQWLHFADDVQPSDAAGSLWLTSLCNQTTNSQPKGKN